MSAEAVPHICPDCDDSLVSAFDSTSGVGAHKRGDHYNTTPDTRHYLCLPCGRAWKQRLNGPLTPDVVGDLAFFTCGIPECGAVMTVTHLTDVVTETVVTCAAGHRYAVARQDGDLTLAKITNE